MTIKKIKLKISGMTCEHCAQTIVEKVSQLDGIIFKNISYPGKYGEFEFDADKLTKSEIIEMVNSTGAYKVIGEARDAEADGSNYDLIIIGGGSAAFAAAITASDMGKKILMINDGLPIGGTCVNVGCVPSKTLIRTAEQFHLANHPGFSALKPGNNQIDFKEIIHLKKELVEELRQRKYTDVLKDDHNVTILKGFAKLRDKNTVEVEGQYYSAEHLLIATGSRTFIPNIPGLGKSGYLTNKGLYDLRELPEHLIVIGGRYIALENAQLFNRLGSKVTLLQRSARILPTEMPDITETLKNYLEGEGLTINTNVEIHSVERQREKVFVKALIDGKEELIEGTCLFIATGRRGNTENTGFKEAGIGLLEKGFIATNEYLQTSLPNIYAAGDITGEYLFVYSAAYEGSLAVRNMFGEKMKKDYSVFPWVIFTDPQVAGVGMDENQASEKGIDYEVSRIQLADVPRSLAARNTKGFIKLLRNKENDQLIGARILASEGSELLMEIALAISYGITVGEIKNMFHPYLTLSEGIKLAAIGFDKDVNKLSCCAI